MHDQSPKDYPWFIAVRFRYHPHLINWTKEIPGCYREKLEDGTWINYIPEEMIPALYTEAKKCKVSVIAVGSLDRTAKVLSQLPDKL